MSGTPQNNRIRQIAILVSSVDAATSRQLLLHLPTATAKEVRAMAAQLGPVSAEEKRRILTEFQRTAGGGAGNTPKPATNTSAPTQTSASALPQSIDAAHATLDGSLVDNSTNNTTPAPNAPAWTRLSTPALLRFVHDERPAVIAVVVSQLPPATAVSVLQELPQSINRDVLMRLAKLGEIDREAKAAIDEYLAERLTEYQHNLNSESENNRRIDALLSAAPLAIREQWQAILHPLAASHQASAMDQEATPASAGHGHRSTAEPTAAPPYDFAAAVQASPTQADSAQGNSAPPSSANDDSANDDSAQALYRDAVITTDTGQRQIADSTKDNADAVHILPFNQSQSISGTSTQASNYDRSLTRLEFERVLELPATELAQLLSAAETQTVLLALAGASPAFMDRFYRMLQPADATALRYRLPQIGAIQLRDIDEAQRRLVELQISLNGSSGLATSQRSSKARQAA